MSEATQTPSAQAPADAPAVPAAPAAAPVSTPEAAAVPEVKAEPAVVAPLVPAPAAPEEIKLELPKDAVVDPAVMAKFKDLAKEGLTPQKALDFYLGLQSEAQKAGAAQFEAWKASHVAALKADPVFGREYDKNVAIAKSAFARFGSDAMFKDLDGMGLGNYPALIKFAAAVGRAISEDSTHQPRATTPSPAASLADRYPSMYNADGTPK